MNYFDKCKIKFLNIGGGDMSDAEYFALKGYTSISRLKLLDPLHGGSPQKYLEGTNFGYNESLLLGTAVHCNILQQDEFTLSDYEGKPSGKLGLVVETIYKFRQQGYSISESITKASDECNYYKGLLTKNKIKNIIKSGLDYYIHLVHKIFEVPGKETFVLSKKLLYSAKKCIHSIQRNNTIQNLLSDNLFEPKQLYNEIALFTDVLVTLPDGTEVLIPVKGKLDSVIWDPEKSILYLNDIKTTSKNIDYFMDAYINGECIEGVFSHHVYMAQLGLYNIMLQMYFQQVLNINDYQIQSNIFAVETTGEYRSQVFRISNSYIDLGIQLFKQFICRLAYHQTYGFDKSVPEA